MCTHPHPWSIVLVSGPCSSDAAKVKSVLLVLLSSKNYWGGHLQASYSHMTLSFETQLCHNQMNPDTYSGIKVLKYQLHPFQRHENVKIGSKRHWRTGMAAEYLSEGGEIHIYLHETMPADLKGWEKRPAVAWLQLSPIIFYFYRLTATLLLVLCKSTSLDPCGHESL